MFASPPQRLLHRRHLTDLDKVCATLGHGAGVDPIQYFSGNVGPTMDVKAIGTLAALNNWLKGTRPGRTTLLSILPGSGINQTTAPLLMRGSYDALDPLEIHLSGGHWVSGSVSSQYRKENMGMGVDGKAWDVWKTDESRVRATRDRAEDAIRDELKKGDKNPSLNGSERKA